MNSLNRIKPVAAAAAMIAACALTGWGTPALAADAVMSASSGASTGMAPASGATPMSAAKGVNKASANFAMKAAAGGMYEVQVSKLAADRAASADVKSFAQMLVDDHTAANAELTSIAQSKGITLPTAIPKAKQANIDKLSKLNGKAFDQAFIEQVGIKDHREDIALFDGFSKTSGDADLKAFATKTLPKLRHHFNDAQGLPKKMAGNMSGSHISDAPKP